jgi:hypothetical protein
MSGKKIVWFGVKKKIDQLVNKKLRKSGERVRRGLMWL